MMRFLLYPTWDNSNTKLFHRLTDEFFGKVCDFNMFGPNPKSFSFILSLVSGMQSDAVLIPETCAFRSQ